MCIRAAKYLGVAPWDLVEQPLVWLHWALECESAEKDAENRIQQQRQNHQKAQRRAAELKRR